MTPSNTRRFRLRERTSPAHASLDHLIGQFSSVTDYGRYVLGLYAFRIPLEQKLAAVVWPAIFDQWRPQLIGHALRADVLDLALTPSIDEEKTALLPLTTESLLGTLYVLEGSALGAKILFRRAQDIGLGESFGARHLAQQSAVDNWRSFQRVLEQETAVEFEAIVTAANATFHAAERAFTGFQHVEPA